MVNVTSAAYQTGRQTNSSNRETDLKKRKRRIGGRQSMEEKKEEEE
jgi:hypothetical protein